MSDDETNMQKLKGFREFLPEETRARRKLFETMRDVAQRFGFRDIDTPSLEPMDLYLVKSGEELVEQTYSFEDKGGRNVTLTPEETPTRARMIAEHKDLAKPVKWFSASKFWRYEAPQKGRLREFYQFNFDIIGEDSVWADAEVLACAAEILNELGLDDAAELRINDRRLLDGILQSYGIDETDAILQIVDDKEKMERDEFREELQEEGLSEANARIVDEVTEQRGDFDEVLPQVENLVPDDEDSRQALERIKDLRDALASYDVLDNCIIDLSIIRGLAYYTGLVFEIFDTKGDLRALSGGGRYDDLIGMFGGEDTPAVGFAPGDATIELLMRREGVWPEERFDTDVYILNVSESVRQQALELAKDLRAEGLCVETDVAERNFGNQMDYANAIDAAYLLIVGERDLENDEVTVKDMGSGDEEQVALDDVVAHVADLV
ncbi:MAG: histidine--tRNA ligase [Candidatus Nanohaloarchaea archaeon]|nr:histidine--tRNA ligase [Candidatus Nanohaloarchaea archaeon]